MRQTVIRAPLHRSHDTVATDDDDRADSPVASGKRKERWRKRREEINFTGIFVVENKECLRIGRAPRHAEKKIVKIIELSRRLK